MLSNISLQQIRYFTAVAEFQNISRAAEFLHTSQSTISKSIASLEKQMEVQLFLREKKQMLLTEAGRSAYEKCKAGMECICQGIDEARLMAGGTGPAVRVGVFDSHNPNLMVLPAAEYFQKNYPGHHVLVKNAHGYDVSRDLLHQKLDVVFRIRYDESELQREVLNHHVVAQSPLVVCMHKRNPLAHKKLIRWKDLGSCRWIVGAAAAMPYYRTMIGTRCECSGYQPILSKIVDNANSMIYNLQDESEIFICDKFWRDYGNEGYVWKTIADTCAYLMMEYRIDNQKPEVLKFVQSVPEMIRERTGEPILMLEP